MQSDHSNYANRKAEEIVYPLRFELTPDVLADVAARIAQAIDDAYANPRRA